MSSQSDPVAADEPRRPAWMVDSIAYLRAEHPQTVAAIEADAVAEARSLSDSEPPPVIARIREVVDEVLGTGVPALRRALLWKLDIIEAELAQPQPALPFEPPSGYKSWADVDLELAEAEGDTGAEPERERAGDPLDVERLAEWFHNKWEGQGIACGHGNQHMKSWDCGRDALEAAEYARLSSQSPVASEDHEHNFVNPDNEAVAANGWTVCTICGLLQEPSPVASEESPT